MLSASDRALFEALKYDPNAARDFDALRFCLTWSDERPRGLSPSGYELLGDLWIIRGFIHRGIPQAKWGLDPRHFSAVWRYAKDTALQWPGFQRLTLSPDDAAFLKSSMSDPNPF